MMDEVDVYIVHVEMGMLPVASAPTWTTYLVIADSDDEALSKVQGVIPFEWNATRAEKGSVGSDLVRRYGLRSGRVHRT
jgi:hypothetical protein